jgi:hypothetical protein
LRSGGVRFINLAEIDQAMVQLRKTMKKTGIVLIPEGCTDTSPAFQRRVRLK